MYILLQCNDIVTRTISSTIAFARSLLLPLPPKNMYEPLTTGCNEVNESAVVVPILKISDNVEQLITTIFYTWARTYIISIIILYHTLSVQQSTSHNPLPRSWALHNNPSSHLSNPKCLSMMISKSFANTNGTRSLRMPNLSLKLPRKCPKSMWNSCPPSVIIILSECRSPMPSTYVATQ